MFWPDKRGESGSGKSTLLKVLALMRHIFKQLSLRSYLKLGGNVSFDHSEQTEIVVVNYEKFLNGLSGTAFEKDRKQIPEGGECE